MSRGPQLPELIKPMLAQSGRPFDSPDHLFEIKWDGIRTLVYAEAGGYRLHSRRGVPQTEQYPELSDLQRLPAGTVLDGELVLLDERGVPDFHKLLRRSRRGTSRVDAEGAVTLVVFDQLYHEYGSLMREPFRERRARMCETVSTLSSPRVVASDGVRGRGCEFFQTVVARELEGVVAKRLDGLYLPGRRSAAWIKIRKQASLPCLILGYIPKGSDFESLILAAEQGGKLRCVGRVGIGFNDALRSDLMRAFRTRIRPRPLIPCRERGCWVEPEFYCEVRFLEQTRQGDLREPVFQRLIEVAAAKPEGPC